MDVMLTRDSDALLCLIYKNYLKQLKDNVSKTDAKWFDGYLEIQKSIAPKWTPDRVDETLRELSRANMLQTQSYDNHIGTVILSDLGIIYMENRFKNGLDEVLKYLTTIAAILPV